MRGRGGDWALTTILMRIRKFRLLFKLPPFAVIGRSLPRDQRPREAHSHARELHFILQRDTTSKLYPKQERLSPLIRTSANRGKHHSTWIYPSRFSTLLPRALNSFCPRRDVFSPGLTSGDGPLSQMGVYFLQFC
uniref:Uncharacterized protein n=1 Tax=Knipowitschia caucasica TaxID=637954 RepID=A0AAV2KYT7_KNICA